MNINVQVVQIATPKLRTRHTSRQSDHACHPRIPVGSIVFDSGGNEVVESSDEDVSE